MSANPASLAAVPGRARTGCRIGMLLLPGFNGFAAQGFVDPFRAANYLRGERIYAWDFLSPDGGTVTASSGFEISTTRTIAGTPPHYDLLLINASWTPEAFRDRALQSWLRLVSRQGGSLGGVDTGAFVLAFAGLIERHKTVVHYEHLAAFNELFPDIPTEESL